MSIIYLKKYILNTTLNVIKLQFEGIKRLGNVMY